MSAATAGLTALGLALGGGLGALLERSHFCTMGAVADVVLFRSWRRARAWIAVAALATLATQSLNLIGSLGLDGTMWPVASLGLGLAGGLFFGVGMVLAGGCASRLWVRAGSGSAKALLALVAMAAGAFATLAAGVADTPATAGDGDGLAPLVRGLAIALGVAIFGWTAPWRDRGVLGLILVLAAALVVGWLVAAAGGAPTTVNYQPALALAAVGGGLAPRVFPLALLIGTLVGAAAAAVRANRFGREQIADADDLRRHVLGGAAMGVGGTLAGGCTLGAGAGGVALLAPAAAAALLGMVAGAGWMVHVLASGGWRAALRALMP